jgi:septal ring factor EnvC (AmiA/AmiB activator)
VTVVRSLDHDLDELKKNYANMVYYAYKHRSAYDKLLFLFSAKDFERCLSPLEICEALQRLQAHAGRPIHTTQSDLKKQLSRLKVQREDKKKVVNEQEDQKKKLSVEKSEKDKLSKTLSKQEKELKASIDKKKKEQDALKKSDS